MQVMYSEWLADMYGKHNLVLRSRSGRYSENSVGGSVSVDGIDGYETQDKMLHTGCV